MENVFSPFSLTFFFEGRSFFEVVVVVVLPELNVKIKT